jgi:N-acyl homoserine lactone hydrolase
MSRLTQVPAPPVRVILHALRGPDIPMPPGMLYRDQAKGLLQALGSGVPEEGRIRCPVGSFLIEHPFEGPVLIDTGFNAGITSHPLRNLGLVNGIFYRHVQMTEAMAASAQLRARGISPSTIRTVVMTHLHADHTSAMSEFPHATFVSTAEEWRAARKPFSSANGYVRRHLPAESRMRFVDFKTGESWQGLDKTIDLFEDGSLRLVSTRGHSVGHLSVLVESVEGPIFVLGDAVYTLRHLSEDVLPWNTADDDVYLQTRSQLRAYARSHPQTTLIPTHDADAWNGMAAA